MPYIMLTDPTYNSDDDSSSALAESPPPTSTMRTKPVRGKRGENFGPWKYAKATEVVLRIALTICVLQTKLRNIGICYFPTYPRYRGPIFRTRKPD